MTKREVELVRKQIEQNRSSYRFNQINRLSARVELGISFGALIIIAALVLLMAGSLREDPGADPAAAAREVSQ